MIELKPVSRASTDMDILDQSSSKFSSSINNSGISSITTIAPLLSSTSSIATNTVNMSKVSSASTSVANHNVDSIIHFPINSYQQAQVADTMYAPSFGSTVNHSNNIVLTSGSSVSNYGATSSTSSTSSSSMMNAGKFSSTSIDQQPQFQLSSGAGVQSIIEAKQQQQQQFQFPNTKYKTGTTVSQCN
jgi:hypothetical protein